MASDLPLRTMLLCCLQRDVEASCSTLRRRLPSSTNSAAYQRLVSTNCHGPSQLCILHLPLQPFTARDGARYWFRIATSAYPTCIRRPHWGRHLQNTATTFGMEKKQNGLATRWWKNFEDTIFLVSTEFNVTDGQTDTAWLNRPKLTLTRTPDHIRREGVIFGRGISPGGELPLRT